MTLRMRWNLHAAVAFATLVLPIGEAKALDEPIKASEDPIQDSRQIEESRQRNRFNVQVGPRPYYIVDRLPNGPLKARLEACSEKPLHRTKFSIGHRGAALQFPEHTKESYEAAARMGAGIVECDVTFTKDRQLVCRHDQCDLHTTTNILTIPALAKKCTGRFSPASQVKDATATCCTSDLTLAEFRQLKGKMDGFNPKATTPADYQKGTPVWRTEAYDVPGTLMTLKEHLALTKALGVGITPELKTPRVKMPYQGTYTQQKYAQQMIDEIKAAGISPRLVWAQSFLPGDITYWIDHEPDFGRQAVALYDLNTPADVLAATAALPGLRAKGVRIIAPPTWALVTLDSTGAIVPSAYARAINRYGFDIITWTLERSGPLTDGGGYYFQSIAKAVKGPGDYLRLLDVLTHQVGVIGVFSDWPGTVTYYANCFDK